MSPNTTDKSHAPLHHFIPGMRESTEVKGVFGDCGATEWP